MATSKTQGSFVSKVRGSKGVSRGRQERGLEKSIPESMRMSPGD